MSSLRVKRPADGHTIVTPESAGWTYVGFEVDTLEAGASAHDNTGARELCLVFVSGRGRVTVAGKDFGEIGERMSPFDGPPAAVYVPTHTDWRVTATTRLELAGCSAPGGASYEARVIPPGSHPQIARGKGSNTRYVTDILPEEDPAHSLLVVEVITPAGHTSSYPSHKHDTDDLPNESLLEETYYHRFNPPQGFAMQRIYTDDRSLDVAVPIEDGDVTLVPRGYHPVAAIAGYDLYYLNTMAGPKRTWKFHNEPAHEWLLAD